MKLNINLSGIKWILFHNGSCYGLETKIHLPVDPDDLYPEDYGAVDLTMIVDDIPDEYKLYQYKGGELIAEPKPVWIPEKGEKVMVRNKREWFRRYSFGKLDEYNNLLCYSHGMDEWSGFDETDPCDWREWRKPTEEELR